MKKNILRIPLILFVCCVPLLLLGCQNSSSAAVSPFCDASWDYTDEDIIEAEGSGFTTYDSVYGGLCYTYPKTYENYEGTIKYMLDEENRLMCIAWTYSSESDEELEILYQSIQQSVAKEHGEDSYNADETSNYGNVWYREEGNIIISTMITSDLKALQYAYLHPDISSSPKE